MIQIDNLNKTFKLYKKPSDRLKEGLFGGVRHTEHHALKNLSFRVEQGETLGILGRNGAGKSTLLKILNGVLKEDSGVFAINGKITGLLELGTGFDYDLTGLANITSNGLLIGMSRAEIASQLDAIIEFSELGEYINEPVRTYSSGMVMRLAFSIAIHANPSCFLVDEALSVGDGHFQQKCIRRIKEFRDSGGSIIFVSHDMNAVKVLCDRVIVLDQGRIGFEGDPEDGVNFYNQIMAKLDEPSKAAVGGYGNRALEIKSAVIQGDQSKAKMLQTGEKAVINVEVTASQSIDDFSIGVLFRDRFGQDLFGTNTVMLGLSFSFNSGETKQYVFEVDMNIAPGKYTGTLALHSGKDHLEDCYHWWDNVLRFEVAGTLVPPFSGLVYLPTSVSENPALNQTN